MGLASPQYPDGGRFIGEIDDVRIYSTVLGEEMADDLYNHGLSDHGLTVEPFNFDTVQDPNFRGHIGRIKIQKIRRVPEPQ